MDTNYANRMARAPWVERARHLWADQYKRPLTDRELEQEAIPRAVEICKNEGAAVFEDAFVKSVQQAEAAKSK